jgi:hypothetical protein
MINNLTFQNRSFYLIILGKKNPIKKWGKTHRDTHKL